MTEDAGDWWEPVDSANVRSVRRAGRDLEVRFRGEGDRLGTVDRQYRYLGAGHLLEDLLAAGHKGRFVRDRLEQRYARERISTWPEDSSPAA